MTDSSLELVSWTRWLKAAMSRWLECEMCAQIGMDLNARIKVNGDVKHAIRRADRQKEG